MKRLHRMVDGKCVVCWKRGSDCFKAEFVGKLYMGHSMDVCEGPPQGLEALKTMASGIGQEPDLR